MTEKEKSTSNLLDKLDKLGNNYGLVNKILVYYNNMYNTKFSISHNGLEFWVQFVDRYETEGVPDTYSNHYYNIIEIFKYCGFWKGFGYGNAASRGWQGICLGPGDSEKAFKSKKPDCYIKEIRDIRLNDLGL